ncbi:MAG: response regulator [Chloroflexaceae bacterium]|nr:response regulator [Chloroflexaceae bacterium]
MENPKGKILVVDDEPAVQRILKTRLSMAGYEVVTAGNGKEALEIFSQEGADLIVLDVMLPYLDGYYVCQEIRKTSDVPIVMLTALADVADRITGLQFGADDYLVKPFSPKELEARINRILRRVKPSLAPGGSGVIAVGCLRIDLNKRRATLGDRVLSLTDLEFNLLQLLASRCGAVISRGEILTAIWGYVPQRHQDLRIVDVYISRLRAKIERDPKHPELIITERGTGYLFRRFVNNLPEAAIS